MVFFDSEKFATLMSANNKRIDDGLYFNVVMYWHLCQQSRKQYVDKNQFVESKTVSWGWLCGVAGDIFKGQQR